MSKKSGAFEGNLEHNAGARGVARRVLDRVERGAYATLALSGELDRAELSAADRALATEITYGVLRQRARIDHTLNAYAKQGIGKMDAAALLALRVGAYQLLFLKNPAHAVVNDAVNAVKKARSAPLAGVVNAILRRIERDGEVPPPKDAERALCVRTSSPAWLVAAVRRERPDGVSELLESFNQAAPVWIRGNPRRITRAALAERLKTELPDAEVFTPEFPDEALRLEHAASLFRCAAYGEGLFLAQDVAAQLIGRFLAPQAGERVLDACAGIGGKSTHLAILGQSGLGQTAAVPPVQVDAADLSSRKLELAADHANRLGLDNIKFVVGDLRENVPALAQPYRRILLDAPCSALGVLRRHPEAKWRAEPNHKELSALQLELLEKVAARLEPVPEARLVYAVCTFVRDEGEGVIERFLERHPEFVVDPPTGELQRFSHGSFLRTWPDRDQADAFFAARLRLR